MTTAACLNSAREALADNSPGDALDRLRPLLDYPGQLKKKGDWRPVFLLLQQIFAALEMSRLAGKCQAATLDPTSAEALHQFGTELVAQRLPLIAATVLAQAHALAPEREDVLAELVAALELAGRYEDARRQLAAANGQGFLIRYLLAFNTLMVGDLLEARRLTAALNPANAAEVFMRARLDAVFARIDAIRPVTSLSKDDRRGWHFALTGGLLLHLAKEDSAGPGRYGHLEDSEALCLEGIRRFAAVSEVLGLKIPRVLAFENPESHRLGLAVADVLGVPSQNVFLPDQPGLFVAYDLGSIIPEILENLRQHRDGLVIFSHASQWTAERRIASDFTTLQYGSIVTPWNRHAIFPWRPDLPKGPPSENDDELAARLTKARVPASALSDMPQLLALAEAGKELAAARQRSGVREQQWIGI